MLRPATGESATPRIPLFPVAELADTAGPPGKGGSNCCSAGAGAEVPGSGGSNDDDGAVFAAGVAVTDLGCGAQGSALVFAVAVALLRASSFTAGFAGSRVPMATGPSEGFAGSGAPLAGFAASLSAGAFIFSPRTLCMGKGFGSSAAG